MDVCVLNFQEDLCSRSAASVGVSQYQWLVRGGNSIPAFREAIEKNKKQRLRCVRVLQRLRFVSSTVVSAAAWEYLACSPGEGQPHMACGTGGSSATHLGTEVVISKMWGWSILT